MKLRKIFAAVVLFLSAGTAMAQQIANELSFPNASAFGTFFKKHTGLSPKHYRNWEEGNEPPSFK